MTARPLPSAPDARKPRRRTRLRSGKIANLDNRFVCECQIVNRTLDRSGARLRLVDPVPVPQHFRLFDDELATLFVACTIWRHGRDLGVRLQILDRQQDTAAAGIAALTGKFYAAGR